VDFTGAVTHRIWAPESGCGSTIGVGFISLTVTEYLLHSAVRILNSQNHAPAIWHRGIAVFAQSSVETTPIGVPEPGEMLQRLANLGSRRSVRGKLQIYLLASMRPSRKGGLGNHECTTPSVETVLRRRRLASSSLRGAHNREIHRSPQSKQSAKFRCTVRDDSISPYSMVQEPAKRGIRL